MTDTYFLILCNSEANRHEIWIRLRKGIKCEVWTISLESVKFQQKINENVQTGFEKKSRLSHLDPQGRTG